MVLDVSGPVTLSLPIALGDSFSYAGVPNGSYTFAVRAVNAAGSSAPSNTVTLTFPGSATCTSAPLAPTSFFASRTGSVVSLSWQPPAGGASPTRYIVSVGGSVAASFPTTGLTLSGVAPSGTYVLSVRATNACGEGPASESRTVSVP
jgi:predicted phage tail protein